MTKTQLIIACSLVCLISILSFLVGYQVGDANAPQNTAKLNHAFIEILDDCRASGVAPQFIYVASTSSATWHSYNIVCPSRWMSASALITQ